MNTKIIKFSLIVLTLNLLSSSTQYLYGQEDKLNKEVQVVRPYEPSISDAFKINLLPKIDDTLKLTPNLSYTILQRPIISNYTITPITAARMVQEQLNDLSNAYIKLGFGNSLSPIFEAYYNSGRNKDYSYGGWVQNHSSFGKIKLDNGKQVDSDFGRTDFNLFGKKILKKSIINADAGFNKHKVTYYGYDIYAPTGTIYDPNAAPKEQHFNQFHANIDYYSSNTDSTQLNYRFETGFNHLSDNFDMQESLLEISIKMDKFIKEERFGGEFSINHYMKNSNLDSANNTIIRLSPWINLYGKQWRALVGTNLIIDANSSGNQSTFYPMALLSYDIISHYLIPYVEINGYLEENSYAKITAENPWLIPGKKVFNTSHKFILKGGIKGNLSTKVSYNVFASYSLIDSMYFFTNANLKSSNPLFNRFTAESDNVELTKILGELTIAPSSKINLFFRAEYNNYRMHKLLKPWQIPDYNALASIRYNIKDKIILNLDVFSMGKRYVKTSSITKPIKSLEGVSDINVGIEYRYNKKLSAFLNLNNLTSSKYDIWYLYPMYRFNIKAGLTYNF
ncbi:MAG: hypothetical protein HXX16_09445 [Bacteroidales bacterium]|nr:hypothetical protein [Bacteroidales bacterium]